MAAVSFGSADATGSKPATAASSQPMSWLAAGDSYSAGYGLPGSAGLIGADCHPAPSGSWPLLTRDRIAPNLPFEPFTYIACTGGKREDLFSNDENVALQWDGHSQYDLVTFSYGGNDAGFRNALIICAGGNLAGELTDLGQFDWLVDSVAGCPPDGALRSAIGQVGNTYPAFLRKIVDAGMVSPGGHVVVMGYPAIFEEPDKWNLTAKATGLCHTVNREGARRIRGWAGLLNARVGGAVQATNGYKGVGFTFVNVQDGAGNPAPNGIDPLRSPSLYEATGSADRHNLCGSDSWMFGTFRGNFHPNDAGHQAMSRVLAPIIEHLDWSRLNPATPPPVTSTPATAPPAASPPATSTPATSPPATTKTLTVYNQVTNGGTQIREDTPAYLATVTKNFCRRDGCMLSGTDVLTTGSTVVAECWANGDRTTNGQDNSAIDDSNPNLYQSTRWYRVRWPDGRWGYLSEVWITAAHRGGAGLPPC